MPGPVAGNSVSLESAKPVITFLYVSVSSCRALESDRRVDVITVYRAAGHKGDGAARGRIIVTSDLWPKTYPRERTVKS